MSPMWRPIFIAGGFGIGVAIVAALAVIAYALVTDEGGGPPPQAAQPTQTAMPRPSPTATPQASPNPVPATATPRPTPTLEATAEPTEQPPPIAQEPVTPPADEPPSPLPPTEEPPFATPEPESPTRTATPPTPVGDNGELRLGDTATIGDARLTVKSVTYGFPECRQLIDPSGLQWLGAEPGYEVICVEYDEVRTAVLIETPTATPGKRIETKLVDSAGEENDRGLFLIGVAPEGNIHLIDAFTYPQGRRAVAFIYRDLWAGEEARWSLE